MNKLKSLRTFHLEFQEFVLGQKQLSLVLNGLCGFLHSVKYIHHILHCHIQLTQLLLVLVCVPGDFMFVV